MFSFYNTTSAHSQMNNLMPANKTAAVYNKHNKSTERKEKNKHELRHGETVRYNLLYMQVFVPNLILCSS